MSHFDRSRFRDDFRRLMKLTVADLKLAAELADMDVRWLVRKRDIAESMAYQLQKRVRDEAA